MTRVRTSRIGKHAGGLCRSISVTFVDFKRAERNHVYHVSEKLNATLKNSGIVIKIERLVWCLISRGSLNRSAAGPITNFRQR
jgi:hypothetical protein